jgi:hypothetical protein
MEASWDRRRPWLEASRGILAAANTGQKERASALLRLYLEANHAELTSEPLNLSQRERRAMIAEMGAEMDALFAETERIRAEKRTRASDAQVVEVLAGLRLMKQIIQKGLNQ